MKPHPSQSSGFSLVEIVIAIGVASASLIPVSGLLLVGMRATQSSSEQTAATNIGVNVIADLEATGTASKSPQYGISIPTAATTTPVTFYIDETGSASTSYSNSRFNSAPTAQARYRITVGFTPPASGQRETTQAHVMVTWPVKAAQSPDEWPTGYTGCWETVTALNNN